MIGPLHPLQLIIFISVPGDNPNSANLHLPSPTNFLTIQVEPFGQLSNVSIESSQSL